MININKQRLLFLGDVHGKWNDITRAIIQYDLKDTAIFQVGDFGMGFTDSVEEFHRLQHLNDVLALHNSELLVIRGNHDNPKSFETTNHPYDLPNITLLQDYEELEILGFKILAVGGAYSVDRFKRVLNESYWDDEPFVFRMDFPFKEYDIVVTHTRPRCAGLPKGSQHMEYYKSMDDELHDDVIEEAYLVNLLYAATRPKHWFYGHFHESLLSEYENTQFRCLDISELYEIRQDNLDSLK